MSGIRTGDRDLIRELNTAIVLNCLHKNSPISRSQIADMTGMGRSTVSGIVAGLHKAGLIESIGTAPSTGGRKPEMLALQPRRFYAAGIKLEPGAIRGCLTDLNGHIIHRAQTQLSSLSLDAVLGDLQRLFAALTQHINPDDLLGVGVALPGLVDPQRGVAVEPHFFPWSGQQLRGPLEDHLNVPVWIENDARAGALGERWSMSGDKEPTFLFVTVGLGIGAGIVVSGNLMKGDLVGSGHLGHTLAERNGRLCHCGLRGCLETVANDEALLRFANTGNEPGAFAVPADVFARARQGETRATEAINEVAGHLATAIGNVVKLLGIRRIVIGGETAVDGGALFIDSIHEALQPHLFAKTRQDVEVLPSRLGNDVWLTGAAALVLETLYSPPIYGQVHPGLEKIVANT